MTSPQSVDPYSGKERTAYLRFGRFDGIIWTIIGALILAIILVIWRGDQVDVQVLDHAPAADMRGVSLQTDLRIQFDQPLDRESLPADAVTLSPAVEGRVYVETDTLIFDPAAALAPDTRYDVTVQPGLRSTRGHTLAAPLTWSFQTGRIGIAYTLLDANSREQLMTAAVHLAPEGVTEDVTVDDVRPISEAPFGIWDYAVDRNTGQLVYARLNEDGTSDLWTLYSGASAPELLLACPGAACNSTAFSPDSLLLAYSQRNASDFSAPAVSPPRLWLLALGTDTTARVFSDDQQLGFEPRWSADGAWLGYLSPDLGGVGVYNVETGDIRFYPTTTGEAPVWHPQAHEIILSEMREISGTYEVHMVAIDITTDDTEPDARRELSVHDLPVEDNSPAWSPDGEWLAWRRKEMSGPRESLGKQLWIMRRDGSEARPLTVEPEYDHGPPSWSPDGRYLLYHRFPLRGPDVMISVWIMDVATGATWEVARPGQRPQWVP